MRRALYSQQNGCNERRRNANAEETNLVANCEYETSDGETSREPKKNEPLQAATTAYLTEMCVCTEERVQYIGTRDRTCASHSKQRADVSSDVGRQRS